MMLINPELPVSNLRRRPRRGPLLRRPSPTFKGCPAPSGSSAVT